MANKEVRIHGNTAVFFMNIKRESIGDNREYGITVTVDFAGVPAGNIAMVCFSGSSARVRIQSRLRNHTPAQLVEYEKRGLKIHWSFLMTKAEKEKDPVKATTNTLALLSQDEYVTVLTGHGMDREQAIRSYNNLHGLPVDPAPKNGDGNPTNVFVEPEDDEDENE